MIVKQNGWVWVIGKGNEVSLGKMGKKRLYRSQEMG
jgi:hypothetical protein